MKKVSSNVFLILLVAALCGLFWSPATHAMEEEASPEQITEESQPQEQPEHEQTSQSDSQESTTSSEEHTPADQTERANLSENTAEETGEEETVDMVLEGSNDDSEISPSPSGVTVNAGNDGEIEDNHIELDSTSTTSLSEDTELLHQDIGSTASSSTSSTINTELAELQTTSSTAITTGDQPIIVDESNETSTGTLDMLDPQADHAIAQEIDGYTVESEHIMIVENITVSSTSNTLKTVDIRIQVETIDGQLIDEIFTVTECPILPESATTSLSAWCAVQQMAQREGWQVTPTIFGDALFLSALNAYDGSDFNWWAFFHNETFASEALNQYALQENDHILLSYGIFPSRLVTEATSPALGTTTTISMETFGFDSDFHPAWIPATTATFTVNGTEIVTPGMLTFTVASPTPYSITAIAPGNFRTDAAVISASLPQTTAVVRVETPDGTLKRESVRFTACSQDGQHYSLSAKCALDALAMQEHWTVSYSQFGSQYFLSAIDSYETDFEENRYWLWFHNSEFAQESLDAYTVTEDDELLFAFGVLPTRLSAETSTPTVSSTLHIRAEEFGFDAAFNPVWMTAANVVFSINNTSSTFVGDGVLMFDIATTTPYSISISKDGYAASSLTLFPTSTQEQAEETTPENTCTTCSGGGTQLPSQQFDRDQVVDAAILYLISQQEEDGGFGSLLFSDWVAMAYGTYTSSDENFITSKQSLASYLTSADADTHLSSLTDYERHVLGLVALQQSASTYRQSILDEFDGTQFGSQAFVNDDIFAILALDALGCCQTEMRAAADYIISRQHEQTGRIGDTDLTAAAIRALRKVYSANHAGIAKAKQYLKSIQQSDGSIGGSIVDVDTTSWTLDAIGALDETSLGDWFTSSGETPLSYMLNQQAADGSFGRQNNVWSTAFAILALQHNWQPRQSATDASSGGGNPVQDTTIPTADMTTTTENNIPIDTEVVTTTQTVTTTHNAAEHEDEQIEMITQPHGNTAIPASSQTETVPAIGGVIDDTPEPISTLQERSKPLSSTQQDRAQENETVSEPMPEVSSVPTETITSTIAHPLQKTSRGVATTATVMAGTLGIFLTWRFILALL